MYVNPHVHTLYRTGFTTPRGGYLRLDMNENPEGLPRAFFEAALAGITAEDIAMYPEQHALLEALEAHLGVSRQHLCLCNGSDDAIRLAFMTFGRPGSCVVTVSPTFEMYPVYCGMYGLTQRAVPIREDFTPDVQAMLAAIDAEVSIVALLNPNSPVGRPWSRAETVAIVEQARAVNALVIIDEAYHYFFPDTFLDLTGQYEHIVLLRTFSKLCAIAGCRIGFAAGQPATIDLMRRASASYPVNGVALHLARALLTAPQTMQTLLHTEAQGRQYLIQQLCARGYDVIQPGGNYVLTLPRRAPQALFDALMARGILIKTYRSGLLQPYIRVTTGSVEIMKRFLEALDQSDREEA